MAVNPKGELGKLHGYAEFEWSVLSIFGEASGNTPIATAVRDLQLVDDEIPRELFDVVVANPIHVIYVERVDKKPWGCECVTENMLRETPLLVEVKRRMGDQK